MPAGPCAPPTEAFECGIKDAGSAKLCYVFISFSESGTAMKILQIVPRHRTRLYGALVAKEASIRKSGRGTYMRVGRRSAGATRWKHKMYKGSVRLARDPNETVTVKVQGTTAEDERRLLSSFLGFVDRHYGDELDTITIQYR